MTSDLSQSADSGRACDDRQIGFWTCTALVVGNTIGVGIFMLPAVLAPYGFNALTGWTVTVLGCLALALAFARLARILPQADGPYGYIRSTQGDATAFLAIWCYWLSTWMTNATIAVGVVAYLQAVIPGLANVVSAPVTAVSFLWLFVIVNLFGVRAGGSTQIFLTALKLLPMAAIILFGSWLLVADPGAYTRQLPATPISLSQTMAASTIALFALLGFESACVPASRVRDPGRTIPRATIAGTLLTAAIYVAVSIIPMLLIPQAELASSQAPFAELLNRQLGGESGRWLALFVVVSGLGAINGWTLLVGELTRTMAANGVLPGSLGRCNRRGAPAVALIVTAALATGLVLMNYSRSLVDGFTLLSVMVTAANLPLYLCAAIALLLLRARGQHLALRGLILIGGLGAGYTIYAFVGVGAEPFGWTFALVAAGVPVYLFMRWRRSAPLPAGVEPAA